LFYCARRLFCLVYVVDIPLASVSPCIFCLSSLSLFLFSNSRSLSLRISLVSVCLFSPLYRFLLFLPGNSVQVRILCYSLSCCLFLFSFCMRCPFFICSFFFSICSFFLLIFRSCASTCSLPLSIHHRMAHCLPGSKGFPPFFSFYLIAIFIFFIQSGCCTTCLCRRRRRRRRGCVVVVFFCVVDISLFFFSLLCLLRVFCCRFFLFFF